MRITIIALVVFMVCSICPADVTDVNSMTIEQCRARILELERIVKSQRNQIAKLVAELTEKQSETQAAERKTNSAPSETQTAGEKTNSAGEFNLYDGIVYRGKTRSPQFFNYWYDEFRDRIVYYNGQYLKASAQKYDCVVLQVINDNEAIVLISGYNVIEYSTNYGPFKEHVTNFENNRCHVKGYNGTFTGDNFSFKGCLFGNGSYQYTNSSGVKTTLASYILAECKTLKKEQFADAINNGFELTE